MKANLRAINNRLRDDEGVSPVIAVILMVAITVVLAATVYVWVSGFASTDQGQESASISAQGLDRNNNGATDWIRLTLVRGENAPYGEAVTAVTILEDAGNVITASTANGERVLCNSPIYEAATNPATCLAANSFFTAGGAETWTVGEVLYVPCQYQGPHQVTVTIRGSTILDERIVCDEVAV